MNKLISIAVFLIISTFAYSQETNKELLKKAEVELKAAVESENFEEAAKLKKEISTREQIQEAVEKGDYDTAAMLQKELQNTPTKMENQPSNEFNISTSMKSMGFVKPSKGKVAVYFVRKYIYATALRINIFDSLQCIGGVIGGSYTRYECEPGAHMFWVWAESNDHKVYLPVTLKANESYIIELHATSTTHKEKKLSGKSWKNFPYTLHIETLDPEEKRMQKLITFVKTNHSRSYPADVIQRLNTEFELEARNASANFESIRKNQAEYLKSSDFVPNRFLEQ